MIKEGIGKKELHEYIKAGPRCLFMGHGTSSGLLAVGQFEINSPYIIEETEVEWIAKRKDSIFIWCHADQFVNINGLKGFYTGMFISEELEGYMYGFDNVTSEQIEESNYAFSKCFSAHYGPDVHVMHAGIKRDYGKLAKKNPIAHYNWERLYVN